MVLVVAEVHTKAHIRFRAAPPALRRQTFQRCAKLSDGPRGAGTQDGMPSGSPSARERVGSRFSA
jgi:hypothetical protein